MTGTVSLAECLVYDRSRPKAGLLQSAQLLPVRKTPHCRSFQELPTLDMTP